jgi:hypothetical protein
MLFTRSNLAIPAIGSRQEKNLVGIVIARQELAGIVIGDAVDYIRGGVVPQVNRRGVVIGEAEDTAIAGTGRQTDKDDSLALVIAHVAGGSGY